MQTVSAYIGEEQFDEAGHRYLKYITANIQHHTKLTQELDKLGNNPMWEKCESLFIKVIMDNNRELMS